MDARIAPLRRYLDEPGGAHRERSAERSLLSGYQDQGCSNGGGEEPHCERRRQSVVAVNERDCDQREQCNEHHAHPLHPVDARLAEDDPLTPRVEGRLERGDELALCRFLAFAARRETDRELE